MTFLSHLAGSRTGSAAHDCYTFRVEAEAVVIGAGAAGLMAARSLARRLVRVVMLEARDRVGGRAWSRPAARTLTPAAFVGRAPEQVDEFLREVIDPLVAGLPEAPPAEVKV